MDIVIAQGCAFIPSFACGPQPVRPVPIERLVRHKPVDVVYNLIERAEQARQQGDIASAKALNAEAERLINLVTAH
ncbi:MAG: hypothetical protein Q7S15_02495 [bacterium]|nr:hypothetical protein [bacterium]